MKAKDVSKYVHDTMDRTKTDKIAISMAKLRPEVLEALRTNYGFSKVEPWGYLGYVDFERPKKP